MTDGSDPGGRGVTAAPFDCLEIGKATGRLTVLSVAIRKRLIVMLAGKDAVILNADILARYSDEQPTLHAKDGRSIFGGNCTFGAVAITTNGGKPS